MNRKIYYLLLLIFITSCSQNKTKEDNKNSSPDDNGIPSVRKVINKKPVASYFVTMGDPKLDRKFGAEIFETSKTFKFLLAMQYDGMLQSDTLQIPNFGAIPEIQIKAGPDKLSCIIGFLDKEKNFREYKLMSANDDQLKLTTLKSYGVQANSK